MLGTVGSGLTPGSRPDGRAPEIPEISGKNPEKPEISGNFRKLHMTYQIKALGMLVHVDTLKIQNSGKLGKIYGKTVRIQERHTFVARMATTRESKQMILVIRVGMNTC